VSPDPGGPSVLNPLDLLREAVKAVPAVRYALGLCGLLAVVAIAMALRLNPALAVFGTVVTLVLMVALVVFAKLTAIAPRHFLLPVMVLMWASLVVLLACVVLLASYVFFGQPRGLERWIPPRSEGHAQEPPKDDGGRVRAARLQVEAGDYPAAWALLEDPPGVPSDPGVREARVQVAMAWLRDVHVVGEHTFTEIVDRLTPCLNEALGSASGSQEADLLAHLGWAAYLKRRDDGQLGVDVPGYYARALKLDPGNVYAHAMLGHWMLVEDHRPLAEARPHFEAALAGNREHAYVRGMQLAALRNTETLEAKAEAVKALNEMRKAGEPLSEAGGGASRMLSYLYAFDAVEVIDKAGSAVSGEDQLATFDWLQPPQDSGSYGFARAVLLEKAGHPAEALALYQALLPDIGPTLQPAVKAGVARCTASLAHAG